MVSTFTLLGGLGLFLIGMQVLTDGLRSLAGESLRRFLIRITRNPISGAAAGAVSTAIVQSSSATTVMAVGFVGAGLLSFHQALGVIFGANIGTTITGWIVALVGFKLDITLFVFPLAFIGAMLKLFANGRLQQVGWSLAGFSLIFIGIDALQSGMATYEDLVTPTIFPSDTFVGRLQLVGIGILITAVTQSSSAGVATALVALNVGAISFHQAAAMVIGMDVGTTFTAVIAALGGSTAMRRTGFAHVIYNVFTGMLALALLSPFTAIISNWLALDQAGDAQIALVAFHSVFNIVGVLAIIGFTRQFANLIIGIVPGKADSFTASLDEKLLRDPVAAADAAMGSTKRISLALFSDISASLGRRGEKHAISSGAVGAALSAVSDYTARIHGPRGSMVNSRVQSIIHAQDHLVRLLERYERLDKLRPGIMNDRQSDRVKALRSVLGSMIDQGFEPALIDRLNALRREFRAEREELRLQSFEAVAEGAMEPASAMVASDAIRWLHRSTYHAWRICLHLQNAMSETPRLLGISEERRIELDDSAV